MAKRYNTSMGGQERSFPGTRWGELLRYARTDDAETRQAIAEELARRYWKPVYSYLRLRGCDNESAKDLVQGFFCEIVLGKDLVARADPTRGRFRSFLLTALQRYAAGEHRKDTARKRRPPGGLQSLEQDCVPVGLEPAEDNTPERAFLRSWAANLLDEVLQEVQRGCARAKQQMHWEIFRAWVLAPLTNPGAKPTIEQVCVRWGIADRKTAWNMAETVKRRFRRILEKKVRPLVGSEEDVDREIQELICALSGPCRAP